MRREWTDVGIFAVAIAMVAISLAGFPPPPPAESPIDTSLPLTLDPGSFAGTATLFYFDGIFVDGRDRPVKPENAGGPPVSLARGQVLGVRGWALDAATNLPARRVVGVVDSTLLFSAVVAAPRPDVAKYLHNPDAVASGFMLSIPTVDLPLGLHRLRFRVIGSKGDAFTSSIVALDFNVTSEVPLQISKPEVSFERANGKEIERVAGAPTVRIGDAPVVKLFGWAVADVDRGLPFTRASFYLDGKQRVMAGVPAVRPDIAAYLHRPDLDRVGFDVAIPTANLKPGRHLVALRLEASGVRDEISVQPELVLVR